MNLIQRLLAQFNKDPTPPNIQPVYGAIVPDEPTPPDVQPVYGVILPGEPIGAQPVYGSIRAPIEQSGDATI